MLWFQFAARRLGIIGECSASQLFCNVHLDATSADVVRRLIHRSAVSKGPEQCVGQILQRPISRRLGDDSLSSSIAHIWMLSFLFVDRIFHENGLHVHHFFSTLLILNLFARMGALCYYPNGDASEDIPYNSTAEVSACCTRGWTCLTNGVCQNDNNPADVSWARHSCTDINFFAPECPRFCQSGMRRSLSV